MNWNIYLHLNKQNESKLHLLNYYIWNKNVMLQQIMHFIYKFFYDQKAEISASVQHFLLSKWHYS